MIARALTFGLLLSPAALAQGRPLDWPFLGGDAQRSGWQKSDLRITKENVKNFELVLKRKLAPGALAPPVVIGNLISYKGFKELAFVTGNSGQIWSVDADVNRVFWEKQLAAKGAGCPGNFATVAALTPPTNFTARPRPAPAGSASPGAPPSPAATPVVATKPSLLGSSSFGAPRPAFAVSKDGRLHALNTSTGADLTEPIAFLPAKSRAASLVIADGFLYAAVSDCAGKTGSVWALDLNGEERQPVNYKLKGAAPAGPGGLAVAPSGAVFVAGTDGSLTALEGKTLAPTASVSGGTKAAARATPVVFVEKDREMLVAATADGRLALYDGKKLDAPLARTPPVGAIWGGISTWQDSDGVRWIAAPVWGPADAQLKFGISNGPAPNGSIAAFKVEEQGGVPVLTPAWISRNVIAPEPPVITSGVVFALSAGESGKRGSHAVLYAFDGATGNEMYSTKDQVAGAANLTGLTVANGRVFFTTEDGTLYGFGIHLEI